MDKFLSSDGSEVADGAIGSRGLTDEPRKCQPSRSEGETTRPAGIAPGPSEAIAGDLREIAGGLINGLVEDGGVPVALLCDAADALEAKDHLIGVLYQSCDLLSDERSQWINASDCAEAEIERLRHEMSAIADMSDCHFARSIAEAALSQNSASTADGNCSRPSRHASDPEPVDAGHPADCLHPKACGWHRVDTEPEVRLHVCSQYGCPHMIKAY